MTATFKSNCKGTISFFNKRRGTGLVKPDDGSGDVYINVSQSYDAAAFDRGVKVRYNLHIPETGAPQVEDLRVA
ncbi:MAG: cold-shock protein [Pseudomonadota bacterium]